MNVHYGIVSDRDPEAGKVRVTLPDMDNLPTDWLPVGQPLGTRTNKQYSLPDLDEQVAVALDKHCNAGVVLCSIYSSEDKPDPDNSGLGVYALKLVQDSAAVFLLKIRRAAAGAFSLWSKSSVEIEAGTGLKLTSAAPIAVTAGGETLHLLLKDLVTYLTKAKHMVTPTVPTLTPSPADLVTLTALLVRIEKFTQD